MDKHTIHAVQQWMLKADHDLQSALKLKTPDSNEPLPDTAVYHCQQTAEKALNNRKRSIFPQNPPTTPSS